MGLKSWLMMISWIMFVLKMSWYVAAITLALTKRNGVGGELRLARFVFHELKPFFWVIVIVDLVCDLSSSATPLMIAANGFVLVMDYFNWRFYKDIDNDDDRWKRRKKKLADKVKALNGRLVLVPATNGA